MGRHSSGVCTFQEMVDYFNHKANISGSFPLGSFNSAFSFTGSKHVDAAATKTLSSDGFYIPLAKVQFQKSRLMLQENVKWVVPLSWDPSSLASFIENFGTHVITSITIGGTGKDVIYVKQHHTSPLSKLEIKTACSHFFRAAPPHWNHRRLPPSLYPLISVFPLSFDLHILILGV